ncbi:MAG TPA: hydantoinase/oxoprolinase family protein [Gemmatimonadaceae bacterium]|jgi:N-methylhydantoinase A/oxoprolinase/acetone carboxylase beta subunit
MSGYSVGIDVGGTFTDLIALADDGRIDARKVLSTPADQSQGVRDALRALGAPPGDIAHLAHGTTVATNTLLERTGARVVLCATEGATDVLELRRQDRAALYDLTKHHPAPLVPHERIVSVPERVEPQALVKPLDAVAVRRVAQQTVERAPEVVAVALLHSFHDSRHERALGAALRSLIAGVDVVLSSEVLPEVREYERTATTVAEAYLRPSVGTYLRRVAEELVQAGYPPLAVMTSAGGMRSASEAAQTAASLALSGPAGGILGAAHVARQAGITDALTIDIGGTSADAGLVLGGDPLTEPGGPVAGVPIALPRVLIETVSAGGGSIAWVDPAGALRVGPRSAGAQPGPAAFGRGGTDATVTDAHVVLGNIDASRMSGGVTLDVAAAQHAVGTLAQRLSAPVERVARAIIAAVDAAMARALRRVSVERGIDPRRCALVAFGGGGPLHACALATQLGMTRILVPPHAGVLSALGLALATERRDVMRSVMQRTEQIDRAALGAMCTELADRTGEAVERRWWAHARYVGQGHELDVPVTPEDDGAAVAARFGTLHSARAGFTLERPVEIVSLRHAAFGAAREARLTGGSAGDATGRVRGPAVIALPDAAMWVDAGWSASALPIGGYLVEREK